MNEATTKARSVGCILLIFFMGVFAFLPQIVQSTNTMMGTITIPHYAFALSITPDGKYVYVPELTNVVIISTASNTVMTTVNIKGALGVAISPDGKYAYVANSVTGPNEETNSISVINIATNEVTKTIALGGSPTSVTIASNGEYVYVAEEDTINNEGVGVVSVINTSMDVVTARIIVASSPIAVAIVPNRDYAYVVSSGNAANILGNVSNGTVSVINMINNTVALTINVDVAPQNIAITPNGEYAYVTNNGNDSVSVINTTTNSVMATIVGLESPYGVTVTPDGEYAYVTEQDYDNRAGSVSVISTATNAITTTIPLLTFPYDVAVTPNGVSTYIANGGNSTVSVLSIITGSKPTASLTPTVPEFPVLLLPVALFIFIILLLATVIISRKNWKTNPE